MHRGWGISARPDRRPAYGINRRVFLSLLALLLAAPAIAQTPATPPARQLAQPSDQSQSQQPGQGAQVHTGTSSGLSLDARLQNLLADHQYSRVQAELAQLPPQLAQLYRGVLANRSNDLKTSIQLLEPLVAQVTAGGDIAHEKLLREALAEDYLRSGDWAKAAAAYSALESRLSAQLSSDEQASIELPVKLLPLAKDNPPMTVDPCEPFTMQASEDPLGLLDIPVFVDADSKSWMLDPTAPFNLMDRATAREVGVKISDRVRHHPHAHRPPHPGAHGCDSALHHRRPAHPAQHDGLRLRRCGLPLPAHQYQVKGVLGYPALAALGSITITDEDKVQVRPAQADRCGREGRSAHHRSAVLSRWRPDHRGHGPRWKQSCRCADGFKRIVRANGSERRPCRRHSPCRGPARPRQPPRRQQRRQHVCHRCRRPADLPHLALLRRARRPIQRPAEHEILLSRLAVRATARLCGRDGSAHRGTHHGHLHYLRVLTQPLGSAALDDVYGVLGIDALEQLGSYTFDYRTMRFSVRPE